MSEWLDNRSQVERAICGSLFSAIDAHGVITKQNASSGAKRVYALLKQLRRDFTITQFQKGKYPMAKAQPSITVTQLFNPRFNSNLPKDDVGNYEWTYHVEKCINTLKVRISQYLSPKEVQDLMDDDINVTIVPVSK